MVTKRESPSMKTVTTGVKAVKPRAKKTAASERTDGAAMVVLESEAATSATSSIDPEVRRQMVAAEAYFRAERICGGSGSGGLDSRRGRGRLSVQLDAGRIDL
jgi:hypothetical protein